jgi:hypothetical protein
MRIACFGMSVLLAAVAGCGGVADPSSEASHLDDPTEVSAQPSGTGAQPSVICPNICGTGTQCRYPDGSCQEACNDCLCRAQGGKVVASCPAAAVSGAAQDTPPAAVSLTGPATGDDATAENHACGNTFCTQGTYCCNASCSICVPRGDFCTQQFCQ